MNDDKLYRDVLQTTVFEKFQYFFNYLLSEAMSHYRLNIRNYKDRFRFTKKYNSDFKVFFERVMNKLMKYSLMNFIEKTKIKYKEKNKNLLQSPNETSTITEMVEDESETDTISK